MLEVRRVALHDGSHASLILENGRISKLVAPSGEVARLHWEEDKPSPRQPSMAFDHQPESQTDRCRDVSSPLACMCHAEMLTLQGFHAAPALE